MPNQNKMRYLLAIIFILTCLLAKSQRQSLALDTTNYSPKISLTSRLGIPFGTIAKLEAEIYDGANFRDKYYEDTYLLKINSVNGKLIKGMLLLQFTDETKTLANEVFSLYRLIYKKEPPVLSGAQINKMEKGYIGKKVTLMAYETGGFVGMPVDYGKYRPLNQDTYFGFRHSLVVVSNLKK
jgi:hypothetical protein